MDNMNWLVMELLAQQTAHDLLNPPPAQPITPATGASRHPVTRTLASSLVRLGLRLDPAAGEGLGALDLSLGQPSAGRPA